MSPEERLEKVFFCQWSSFLENCEKKSVLWRRFSTGFSKLQFLCPEEQFEECLSIEKFVFNILFNWQWKFSFSLEFIRSVFKSFSFRLKKYFGEQIVFFLNPAKNFGSCAKVFSDFSQVICPGMSKVLSTCPVQRKFWGVLPGEKECFFNICGLWAKKMKLFGKSVIGKVVKLSFTCPKKQFIRTCRWKKNKISLVLRQRSNKSFRRFNRIFQQDCQTCSPSDRWNN